MHKKRILIGILTYSGLLTLIFDGKTAVSSMQDGINICLQTVIPALFPFFLLSPILISILCGYTPQIFKKVGQACKIPNGCESLFLIGLMTGYPIGAQLVTQAYYERRISKHSAKRMLGFCNNAGPAFIFGMLSSLFTRAITPMILWFIHILSAVLVGILLPGEQEPNNQNLVLKSSVSLTDILQNSIKAIATVCGWILIFRVILGFLRRWCLWLLPIELQIFLSGILELANGCVLLNILPNESMRFLFSCVFLSFGGFCVCMQTASVTKDLGLGMYFPGKIMQSLLSIILCTCVIPILFSESYHRGAIATIIFATILVGVLCIRTRGRKKL